MNYLPYIRFYTGEIAKLLNGCSIEAVGVFFRLAIEMHDSKRYGRLALKDVPMSPDTAARRCGCSLDQFERSISEMIAADILAEDSDGFLFCPYLIEQHAKDVALARKRAKSGREGMKKRYEKVDDAENSIDNNNLSRNKTINNDITKPQQAYDSAVANENIIVAEQGGGVGGESSPPRKRMRNPGNPPRTEEETFALLGHGALVGTPTALRMFASAVYLKYAPQWTDAKGEPIRNVIVFARKFYPDWIREHSTAIFDENLRKSNESFPKESSTRVGAVVFADDVSRATSPPDPQPIEETIITPIFRPVESWTEKKLREAKEKRKAKTCPPPTL